VNAAGNGFHLRELGHRSIVEDCALEAGGGGD
jgi:hypothetical protein